MTSNLNLRVTKRKTTLWYNWAWPWSRQSCLNQKWSLNSLPPIFWFPRLLKFRTSFRIKSISDITEECAPVLQLRLCDMWQWNVTISVRVTDCHGGVTIVVIRWLWCLDNNLLLSHLIMHTTTNTVQQFIISHSYLTFVFNLYIKLELAKYYKESEMTAFISERSRNSN